MQVQSLLNRTVDIPMNCWIASEARAGAVTSPKAQTRVSVDGKCLGLYMLISNMRHHRDGCDFFFVDGGPVELAGIVVLIRG